MSDLPGARARTVMIGGTCSHAGKSIVAAAICRIYARRGIRVAPFKAQNMALNSFVTAEGGELGRAQAYQAAAAGVEPHVDMNPVLLKPSSQNGSQVVVLGRPVRHMSVDDYREYLPTVWPLVTGALDRLRRSYELVVIEGAGSVAEINLRDHDIVNMRLAVHAGAPMLLVGDVDRGGVFAALLGSVTLMTPEERSRVKAFVINKFRGDPELLDPGLQELNARTGIETLGVIPYLPDWRGDEEDSVGIEDAARREQPHRMVDVAVVRLPFISNFTDFDALAAEDDVGVRYVSRPEDLRGAAVIVLPGTKSTIADLRWLRERGLAAAIAAQAAAGTLVVGICGGYQMLGCRILDPERVESPAGEVDGLGLLGVETVFAGEKRTVRIDGELTGAALGPAGTRLRGYEIHMGRTTPADGTRPLARVHASGERPHDDGAVSENGRVCGSYVHGLFDHPALRTVFLAPLRAAAGMPSPPVNSHEEPRDHLGAEIDRLADHVAAHLDLDRLDQIIGLG